jgi:predicted ATPase
LLHEALRVVRGYRRPRWSYFLRAESLFNVATFLDALPGRREPRLHQRSHGEAFLQELRRFGDGGLYLLGEPEAALSPTRQLAALRLRHAGVQGGSQFIIATHSPLLLAYPAARIYQFDADGIAPVAYEDTEHYAVTRDFLNHHGRRMAELLADEEG